MISVWAQKTIGEICTVIAGQSPEGKYYNSNGIGTPFYQGKKEFGEKFISQPTTWTAEVTKETLAGDILMSVRAPVGPVNFSTQRACIGRGLAAIRPGKHIEPDFLFNFLLKHEAEIVGNAGAVFPSINKSQIESIKLPLPPLPEQQRIVAILDEAFSGIARAKEIAEKNLANAREIFNSYLHGVFENPGEGWVEKLLDDIVHPRCGLSYGIVQPGEDFPDGLPIVRPTDLTQKFIDTNGLKRINQQNAASYSRTTLSGNEILLCVRGTTGTVSIAMPELKGANVTRGIVPIWFDDSIMDLHFAYYQFVSDYIQNQIRAKTYGTALMQINIRDLKKIRVQAPPLSDQKRFVKIFESLYESIINLEYIYRQKSASVVELKKSLLHQAFSGALTGGKAS